MRSDTRRVSRYLSLFPLLVAIALSLGVLEAFSWGLFRLHLFSRFQSRMGPPTAPSAEGIAVPHPYFGFVFAPKRRFFQGTWMQSNSEGFVDREFPTAPAPGECIYGLLGSSIAMSWGMERTEDRISARLEQLLNQHRPNPRCRTYRVLNLGISSHHLYQSVQIFLYYRHLLSGAIFYFGGPECWHAAVPYHWGEPIEFPEWPVWVVMGLEKEKVEKIKSYRESLRKLALWKQSHTLLADSNLVQAGLTMLSTFFQTGIARLNLEIERGTNSSPPPVPILSDELRRSLPHFADPGYMYDDPAALRTILDKTIDRVVTEPLLQAAAVSRLFGLPILAAIHPLYATTDKRLSEAERAQIKQYPLFQKVCMEEALPSRFSRIRAAGVPVVDLNHEKLFSEMDESLFFDGSHLTREGNRIVADYLYRYIARNWR